MPEPVPPPVGPAADATATSTSAAAAPPAGFVKLAMRNMVRKGRQSLVHFGLTTVGLVAFLLLVAWLGRPHLPQ